MKTIAGIPAHNNWLCIASLIDGADEHVDKIIVVDDGSEDKTVKITERTRTGATVVKQGNAGEGVAIRRLIEEAKRRDADALVIIEANCEYSFIANRIGKAKVTDSQSGLRALSRYAMDTIRTKMDGDAVKWEMVVNEAEQGLRIKEVGIGVSGERISGGYD